MSDVLTVPQLDAEQAERVCASLRSWAPTLVDFYRALLDSGAAPDLATGLTMGWWEATLSAGYEAGRRYDDD